MFARLAWLSLAAALTTGCGLLHGAAPPAIALPARAKLLPARVRRLTNLELERSWTALAGEKVSLATELPPDVRQEGYTPNAQQDVSSAWAGRYGQIARQLAPRVSSRFAREADCNPSTGAACRGAILSALGLATFRRPLTPNEVSSVTELVDEAAAQGESFEASLGDVVRALTESPRFLYVTELGGQEQGGSRVRLDDYEIASALSYVLRGGPPDTELLRTAATGALRDSSRRIEQARRLLGMSDTRLQFRRFALEWLEVDGLLQTAKNSQLFPSYEALKPYMLAETEDYVDEVMVRGGASAKSLIASGFASVGPEMARFYGLKTYGPRASLSGTGRLGILQQASFLAAHAHEDVTSPVKRGDFVMRKLLCERLKRPAEIGLEVVMPPPSIQLTNRERLSRHISDPSCAACHVTLDAIGFTFETFDAMGGRQTTDHGRPVSAEAELKLGRGARALQTFASSEPLTLALAENPTISECFARHAFRYFSAQADPEVESAFLSLREQLPEPQRDSLIEVLLAYVGSDLFILREVRAGG